MSKTFDQVKIGDKVKYYDPAVKGNKELETKDYKGGKHDAIVIGFRLNGDPLGAEAHSKLDSKSLERFEGFIDLVYFDAEWLPESPQRMFKPIFEHQAVEIEGRGIIMQPVLKGNEEVELPMPEKGRNVQAVGVPFRGRVGSKTRSWDFE